MVNSVKILVVGLFLTLFFACSSEIARVDLANNKNVSIALKCEKHRQIDFYLDADLTYITKPNLVIDFEFFKGDLQILKGGLDPLKLRSIEKELKTKKGNKNRWQFYGKLDGNFIPPEDTTFRIMPTLIGIDSKDLVVNKFELVLVR